MKKKFLVIFTFLFALIFRLWLTDKGWHVDMWSNAAWGEWIFQHGTKNFYSNSIWTYSWPTQPPLINTVYAINKRIFVEKLGRLAWTEFQLKKLNRGKDIFWLSNFVRWFGYGKINAEIPFQIGFLVTMKFWPIAADLLIACLIYLLSGRKIAGATIYLISPFSWAMSSLWGQYDGVAFALILIAFWGIGKKWEMVTPALAAAAVLIKPTALILIPFWTYWWWRKGTDKPLAKAAEIALALALFWFTTTPYTAKNPFEFARYDLIRIVFEKAEPRLSVNAFNFWRIFTGNTAVNSGGWLFTAWNAAVFLLLNGAAVYLAQRKQGFRFWDGIFLVGAGSWLFLTGMLERYLFAGMTGGLITAIYRPKLFKYWAVWSVIFWVNLFYHWWVPESFTWLKQLLLFDNDVITRFLSAANIGLFAVMTAGIIGLPPRPRPGNSRKSRVRPAR